MMRVAFCFVCMCILFPYAVCGKQYAQCTYIYEEESKYDFSELLDEAVKGIEVVSLEEEYSDLL